MAEFEFSEKFCFCLCEQFVNSVYDRPGMIELQHKEALFLCCGWEERTSLLKKADISKATIGSMTPIEKLALFGPIGVCVRNCFGYPLSATIQINGVSNTSFLAKKESLEKLKHYIFSLMGTGPAGQHM